LLLPENIVQCHLARGLPSLPEVLNTTAFIVYEFAALTEISEPYEHHWRTDVRSIAGPYYKIKYVNVDFPNRQALLD
jgi:hypothetical protein